MDILAHMHIPLHGSEYSVLTQQLPRTSAPAVLDLEALEVGFVLYCLDECHLPEPKLPNGNKVRCGQTR